MSNIVIPGDLLSDDPNRAGEGTFVEKGKVYSYRYGLLDSKDKIRVIPLAGKYFPSRGDVIIGKVVDISFSNWIVDMDSPYEGLLHVSEYPGRVDPQDMTKYIRVGDLIIAKVIDVDPSMKVELTMKNEWLRVLRGGRIIEIPHTRIPRVIGKGGSMINMLKRECRCTILIGKNGRIWLNGRAEDMDLACKTIYKIAAEAHTSGLTDKISEFIREHKKRRN
ncbi:MAG: exosome complex RNA-binding protein Rrp4 [Candidatus Syntropharchaeia archaeon]